MPENRPRSSDRKLTLIAPMILAGAVVLVLIASLLANRGPSPEAASENNQAEAAALSAPPPPPPPPPEPPPPAPLSRSDIIAAAAAAASAYGSGAAAEPAGKDPLVGRRFAISIPFGCDGPQVGATSAQAFVAYDAAARTVKLVARPSTWTALPLVQALPNHDDIERAEGFWVPRPWTLSEACPPKRDASPPPATPTPAAPQTLGLVELFEQDSSRLGQRKDRPYEHTIKLTEENSPAILNSYGLVLTGTVAGFADGRAIRCWSESPDHLPVCLYAVTYDLVAFEDHASGRRLAEWRQ